MRTTLKVRSDARPSGAGRVGITLFFFVWMAIPSVGMVLMVREGVRGAAPWSWKPADCTIVRSGVDETKDDRYAFTIRYTYAAGALSAVEAPTRDGIVYARGYKGDSDYAPAQRLVLRHPPGSRATCYVNPDDPAEAVLKREWPTVFFALPFPLLFIVIGVVVLYYTWRTPKPKAEAASAPISGAASTMPGKAAWVGVAFFGIFFVVGLCVLAGMGGKVRKAFAARSWTPVPATVIKSDVRSHRGDDSTTYSVNVLYSYSVDGRELRSNRYAFMGGSSSGYDGKREVVRRYPPGTTFTAYVNPEDSADAVIERGFTWGMLVLLVPLVFMGVGGVGAYYCGRYARRASTSAVAAGASPRLAAPLPRRFASLGRTIAPHSARLSGARSTAGGLVLKPQHSPALKLLGFTLICLFWNGIVSVFLFQVIKSWASGRGEVCLSVFLIPFVAVGIALVLGTLHSLLAVFNPRCTVTLDREPILGGATEFRWTFTGRHDRIHRLVLRVEGREEATYRQGTNTRTDKNVFFVLDLFDTSRSLDVRTGKARWAVPADTMHSFASSNNKIAWVFILHGHIQGWPDVKDEYALNVAPLPAAEMRPQQVNQDEEQDESQDLVGCEDVESEEGEPPAGPVTGERALGTEDHRWT